MLTKSKIYFFLSLLCIAGLTFSQIVDIKLDCDIAIKYTMDSGYVKNERYSEIFTVRQNGKALLIMPSSTNFNPVYTGDDSSQTQNYSDEDSWGISSKNDKITTRITINRNTGKIYYYEYIKNTNGGGFATEGNGTCRKVDSDKKLF